MEKKKSKFKDIVGNELSELSKIISGEMKLVKEQEDLDKMKEEAKKKNIEKKRLGVIQKSVVLEKEDITNKKVVQNITVFEWEAPERYEFEFKEKMFWIIVAISLLFILLLAVLGHYLLMGAVIATLFFVYVAGTTKPEIVKHKITKRGVEVGNRLFEWYMLDSFWFSKKNDHLFLNIDTKLNFPSRLILLLDEKEMSPLFVLLQDKVLYKDIRKQSRLDILNYGVYIPLEEV